MTKAMVTNNRQAPYGVEKVGGDYVFIQPGKTRTVDVANMRALEIEDGIETEIVTDLAPPPESLAAKVRKPAKPDPLDHDGDGKKGGSAKGASSTRSRGARRRRKAAAK